MFIGHFGVGLGVKKATPKVSLGTLFMASQFLDLLWPTFLLLGWESVRIDPGNTVLAPLDFTSYPISHSLLMACVWGLVFGFVYFLIRRNLKNSVILGLCVLSHWILDFFVHRPDLPLFPWGSALVGLGLWNTPMAAITIESLVFIIGLVLYLNITKPKNKIGSIGFWGLIVILVLIHGSNIAGPPPPNVTAIAWAGQLQWLFVLWAYWVDRNRIVSYL